MECWKKRTVLEKKSLVTLIVLVTFVIGLITLILLVTESEYCYSMSCSQASEHIRTLINPHVKPCDNFYEFVCGNALNQHQNLPKSSTKTLKKILSDPHHNDTKSLTLQKQFYQSCNNLDAIDADNLTTLMSMLSKLGGWPVVTGNNWNESAFDFVEFMVELRDSGLQFDWFLDISVYPNRGQNIIEIGVPDNANKIDEKIARPYVELMTKIAVSFGAVEDVAKLQTPEVMYFENKLANLIDQGQEKYGRRPQLITITEVQQKWQNINWLELINHITRKKLHDSQQVAFYAEEYLPELDKLLKQTTKRTQVNYVMWKLVETYSPFLSKTVRELVHNYNVQTNQTDLWHEDREEFCFEEAKAVFQYSLEAAYVRRHVPEKKKRDIEEILDRIMQEIERHLRQVKWMDENLRRIAINKLQNVSYIIGGPEEMYFGEQFDKEFGLRNLKFNSSNIIQIQVEIYNAGLDKLYSKQHEDTNYVKYEFYELVPSQEVRFYQNFNLLWIPAGSLHDFFYDDDRPNYLNYATIGTTIAQQLLHGLYSGLFRNDTLWSNATIINFNKEILCLKRCSEGLAQFQEINCEENLLEYLSDYAAINLSYKAYQKWLKQHQQERKIPALNFRNEQLFWLSYGTLMCRLPIPELNYTLDQMIQSFRIVGPFRNSPYFSKDFRCESGSVMNPRNKCLIL